MLVLVTVHDPGKRLEFGRRAHREGPCRQVVQQPLAAAGDGQEFAVPLRRPAPRQAVGGKRLVERHEVPVAFGLRERAVHIPEQRAEPGHVAPPQW